MTGQATSAVATRDGHWQLTLYVKSNRHTFVHALDLRTGVAHCIDLPLLVDLTTAGALALSPDQTTLYVAGGYMGSVATIDLLTLSLTRVVHLRAPTGYDVDIAIWTDGRIDAATAACSPSVLERSCGSTTQPSEWFEHARGSSTPSSGSASGATVAACLSSSNTGRRSFSTRQPASVAKPRNRRGPASRRGLPIRSAYLWLVGPLRPLELGRFEDDSERLSTRKPLP